MQANLTFPSTAYRPGIGTLISRLLRRLYPRFKCRAVTTKAAATSRPDDSLPTIGETWVLRCPRRPVDCESCPRLKAFRQFPGGDLEHLSSLNGQTHHCDSDRCEATVHHIEAQTLIPMTGEIFLGQDAQTHPLAENAEHKIDDAEQGSKQRDGQSDAVLNHWIHIRNTTLPA